MSDGDDDNAVIFVSVNEAVRERRHAPLAGVAAIRHAPLGISLEFSLGKNHSREKSLPDAGFLFLVPSRRLLEIMLRAG